MAYMGLDRSSAHLSHGQNSSKEVLQQVMWDRRSGATRLYIRSFDHGSYELAVL